MAITTESNFYGKTADRCDQAVDALLRRRSGVTQKITKGIAAKLAAIGTSAGIFGIAAVFGVASTGTAIGTLSGAAFTSAALAWVGGSMMVGGIVIGVASFGAGLLGAATTGWFYRKFWLGQPRKMDELDRNEERIVNACLGLSIMFRRLAREGRGLDPITANYIYQESLKPLESHLNSHRLAKFSMGGDEWPEGARNRLDKARIGVDSSVKFLHSWIQRSKSISIGAVTAVFIKLCADETVDFSKNERLILDALRRSKTSLEDASVEELSEYVKDMSPAQLDGVQNNIKGIYHEIRFARDENTDGDEYIVELFEATNHPGADVRIINQETGVIEEFQLKATNYISYAEKHNNRYSDIDIFATEEVASQSVAIESSGYSNESLVNEVSGVIDDLADPDAANRVGVSMTTAAIISAALNAGVLLRGGKLSEIKTRTLIEGATISAGAAGLISLLLN